MGSQCRSVLVVSPAKPLETKRGIVKIVPSMAATGEIVKASAIRIDNYRGSPVAGNKKGKFWVEAQFFLANYIHTMFNVCLNCY
jgi:hypothetical protein